MMNMKTLLFPLFILLPILSFSQSEAIRKLDDSYSKVRLQYFYESVIRAAGNVAMGEEGVELTKGIQKMVSGDVEMTDANAEAIGQFKSWLEEEDFETYMEVTNRGNLAGMASYFMNLMGQNEDNGEIDDQSLDSSFKEMVVMGVDDGTTISALCILLIGEKNTQIYEVHGQLQLDNLPEIINRVQKFMDVME